MYVCKYVCRMYIYIHLLSHTNIMGNYQNEKCYKLTLKCTLPVITLKIIIEFKINSDPSKI